MAPAAIRTPGSAALEQITVLRNLLRPAERDGTPQSERMLIALDTLDASVHRLAAMAEPAHSTPLRELIAGLKPIRPFQGQDRFARKLETDWRYGKILDVLCAASSELSLEELARHCGMRQAELAGTCGRLARLKVYSLVSEVGRGYAISEKGRELARSLAASISPNLEQWEKDCLSGRSSWRGLFTALHETAPDGAALDLSQVARAWPLCNKTALGRAADLLRQLRLIGAEGEEIEQRSWFLTPRGILNLKVLNSLL